MAKVHFLLDPSQADIGPWWPVEEKRIREITRDFSFHLIRGRGHAEHITRELQKSETKLLVCAGGDRLVHEVVNALSDRTSLELCLHHEIYQGNLRKLRPSSRSFIEFLKNYLQGERRVVTLDLGEARYQGQYGESVKRYFFSHASFGLPAAVLHRLPETSVRRQAFRVLLRLVPFYRSPAFKFELNGKTLTPRYLLGGFVQNLPWGARGILVAKEAQADDSLLDLIILNRASWPRTIWAAFRLLFKDELTGQFLQRESLRHLKIESTSLNRNVRIEIDGESWGHLPVEIENRASQLKILE